MKKTNHSLFLLILLVSSCSHGLQLRSPAQAPLCFSSIHKLLGSENEAQKQFTNLNKIHEESIEVSKQYYQNGEYLITPQSDLERITALLNLEEMRDVSRGEGIPYASHPIKLSQLALSLIQDNPREKEQTYLFTLIHDVLEEGRGTDITSFRWLKEQFPNSSQVPDAAYILVEPNIREIKTPKTIPYSMIEVVGYARQIEQFGVLLNERALFNASLIDKLFNLFDRYNTPQIDGTIDKKFITKMQWRLAKQGYLLEKMESYGHPDIVKYAKGLHENIRNELGITKKSIDSKINQYKKIESEYSEQIDPIIKREAQLRELL